MNQAKANQIFKYTLYALLLLLFYIVQTVPGLFVLFGAKPVWVIPCALAVAMLEGEFAGGLYGAAAGLLCDLGGFALMGFNMLFFSAFCVIAGLLIIYLMHCNVWGCILFTSLTMLTTRSIEYFFAYGMWGYEGAWRIYTLSVIPVIVYTLLITPIPYLLVRRVHRRFAM